MIELLILSLNPSFYRSEVHGLKVSTLQKAERHCASKQCIKCLCIRGAGWNGTLQAASQSPKSKIWLSSSNSCILLLSSEFILWNITTSSTQASPLVGSNSSWYNLSSEKEAQRRGEPRFQEGYLKMWNIYSGGTKISAQVQGSKRCHCAKIFNIPRCSCL